MNYDRSVNLLLEIYCNIIATYVNQQTKGNKPCDGDQKVDGPVDERATEGEKPDDSQKDGESGDNLSIDEARLGPVAVAHAIDAMKIIAGETSYDGCKSELDGCQQLW